MKIRVNKNQLKNSIPIIMFLLFEIMGMIKDSIFFTLFLGLFSAFTFLLYGKRLGLKKNKYIFCYFLLQTICFCFSHMHNGNVNINGLVYNLMFIPFLLYLLNIEISVQPIKLVFWLFTLYLTACWIKDIDFNNVFETSSRNIISVVYIYLLCLIAFFNVDSFKINYIYYIIPVIFSVLAIGRGGILTTLLLLISRIFIDIISEKNYAKRIIKINFLVSLLLISGFLVTDLDGIVNKLFSRFISQGFHDDARTIIWSRYIDMSGNNIINFFLGAKINNDAYLAKQVSGNLHNSFLSMHARFGMIYLILNIILILKSMRYYFYNRKYIYLLLLCALLFRGLTDVVFATYWGDLIYWYFIFYPYYGTETCKINKNKKKYMVIKNIKYEIGKA